MKTRSHLLVALTIALGLQPSNLWAALSTANLRCEYRENPLEIDAAQPRLSWMLESDQRAEKQVAYQVLVASSPRRLSQNQDDLWDSGKVVSDRSIDAAAIQESDKPALQANGVKPLRQEDHAAVFQVGSCHYVFTTTL